MIKRTSYMKEDGNNVDLVSGLPKWETLARQSWIRLINDDKKNLLKSYEKSIRFSIYRKIDGMIVDRFKEYLKTHPDEHYPSDGAAIKVLMGKLSADVLKTI